MVSVPYFGFSIRSFGSMNWTCHICSDTEAGRCFSIRSFGSMNWTRCQEGGGVGGDVFQYPLFRIDELDNNVLSKIWDMLKFQYPLFRIDELDPIPRNAHHVSNMFQYPLFRIDELDPIPALPPPPTLWFQYPLFRIDELDYSAGAELRVIKDVSVSALSDR